LAIPIALIAAKSRAAISLLAIGVAAYAALLPLNPYLIERFYGPKMSYPIAIDYRTPWNRFQQRPDTSDVIPLEIRNVGTRTMRSGGWWPVRVGYRWFDIRTENFITSASEVTTLPHDIRPDETAAVQAAFRTPTKPGKYLLVLELFDGSFNWFS